MTHSLYFVIRNKDWEKIKELVETIKQSEEFMEIYCLTKKEGRICQRRNSQPFFWFPDKDDMNYADGEDLKGYTINIETGSHVDESDTLYALHWFYFTLAFKNYFKEELKDFEVFYHLEGENEELTEKQMRRLIKWETKIRYFVIIVVSSCLN